MKRVCLAALIVSASFTSFGFDWTRQADTVTLTGSVGVGTADAAALAEIGGIVLSGGDAELVFTNDAPLTVPCTITGDGRIVKRGAGAVTFGSPHVTATKSMGGLGACYFDYYTKKGIAVERGDLWLDPSQAGNQWYGPITVAAGATLHLSGNAGTGLDALNGAGTVDNGVAWTWYHNPDNVKRLLHITNYGDTHVSDFSGTFVGCFSIVASGVARFTGTNSTAAAAFSALKNSNTPAQDRGVATVSRFGRRPPIAKRGASGADAYFRDFPSTFGVGDAYYYGADFDVNFGGTLVYGGEGEETDKKFRLGSSDYYGWPVTFDAGATGGVTFTGSVGHYGAATKTNGAYLRGSNTQEMVVSCDVPTTGGTLVFKKQGTGCWRFAGVSRPGYAGAWHIEEGTLRYDTIADIGEDCALGVATNCYPFSSGKALPAWWQNTARLPYEIELGADGQNPVFEYSGASRSRTTNRRIGLRGSEVTLSSGSNGGEVQLLGGVAPADGADKLLHLTGANAKPSTLGNVTDGANGGVVSVEKDGPGAWALTGDLRFTGPLDVRAGTLVFSRPARSYRWYRLTLTKIGRTHPEGDTGDCTPNNYYVRLRGIALYTADGSLYVPKMEDSIPWDQMTDAQASGSKSFRYPTGWWRGLEPGEVTIGDYRGTEYRTYPDNTLKRLFSNLDPAKTGGMPVYNTYLGCTPGPNNPNAWLPIVFRLPEDAPPIEYYDILADQTAGAYDHVATWRLEGSTDGFSWTTLHELGSCAHTKHNFWASSGERTAYASGANCLAEGRGYKIDPDPGVPDLPPKRILQGNPEVRVAAGATLKAEGHVELARLAVDGMSPSGTLEGLSFAKDGVLDFVNYSRETRRSPVTFVSCTGVENLSHWTLRLNGTVTKEHSLFISPAGVSVGRQGFVIMIMSEHEQPGPRPNLTMDEDFEGLGQRIGASSCAWPAAGLVGENKGSVFFDVVFSAPQSPLTVQRSILNLRTGSRLGVAWYCYGNSRLTFSFSDRTSVYDCTVLEEIEIGRVYRLGCTWDGEVVRVYVDGKVVNSGVQPLPLKRSSVGKLYAGPFNDNWIAPSVWADDVTLRRVRVWDDARLPAEVAAENGREIRPLAETAPTFLAVPSLAAQAAPTVDGRLTEQVWTLAGGLPRLVYGPAVGKSGEMPPCFFRLASDAANLYLAVATLFPGRVPYVAEDEKWTFCLEKGGSVYRFSANAADGTSQSRDGDTAWSGDWSHAGAKEMRIDDSVLWTSEAVIPWSTLGGAPAEGDSCRFNLVRDWTLETFAGRAALDAAGQGGEPDDTWPTAVFGRTSAGLVLEKFSDPTCGDYAETYRLGAASAAKVTYAVSLARRDGAFEPIPLFSHAYSMAKDESLTDSLKVSTEVPGYDALLHTLTRGTSVVMRAVLPFDLTEKLADVTPHYLQERIDIAFKKPFFGTLRLIGPSGELVYEKTCEGVDETIAFPRASAAGDYTVQLLDATGEKLFEKTLPTYPGVGEWERQDFHEDWILPTFEPLRTELTPTGFASTLSLRRYAYDASLLPSSLVSLNEELLSGAAEILVDGVPLVATSVSVVSNAPHHVGFVITGETATACAALTGWLEYDGVSFNRVTVTRTGAGKGSVCVRYRLRPAFAKYLHAASGSGWGAKKTAFVDDGTSFVGAYTTLWTGNEEKGLCFFYETCRDWRFTSGKLYTLEKDAAGLTVTVNVSNQLSADVPFTFEFGLLASPARPLAPGYPLDTLTDSHCTPFNRPGRRPLYDVSIFATDETAAYPGGDLGSFFGDLDTPDGQKQDRYLRHVLYDLEAGSGGRPIPYTCSRYLSVKYPEVAAYIPDWTFTPEVAMDYSNSGHVVYDCCPTTKASDFFVWKYKSMLRRYPGIRGIYCDFGTIHQCSNVGHGCNERTPILAFREFNRRLCVAQVEAGVTNPVVVLHNTDCVQLPAMTFATHLLNGEQVRQASSSLLHDKKDILDTYGYEMFACELSSLPWGLSNSVYMPFDQLSAANGGDEKNAPYKFRMGKASIGACLLHNTMQSLWRNHIGLFDKVLRFCEGFGVDRAAFVGYWRAPAVVTGADDVRVSCYTDGTKVLAVIAQIGTEHHDQDVEIAFDLTKLGLSAPLAHAVDKMTADDPDYAWYVDKATHQGSRTYSSRIPTELGEFGTRIDGFDGQILRYHLPYHTFGLVELTP